MRLIDADEFKNELEKVFFYDNDDMNRIVELIDNAPTVDIPDLSEYEGIANALNIASELLHKKRTQGKWLPNYTSQFFNPGRYCSLCGKIVEFSENYCPKCGAYMRGKENENNN